MLRRNMYTQILCGSSTAIVRNSASSRAAEVQVVLGRLQLVSRLFVGHSVTRSLGHLVTQSLINFITWSPGHIEGRERSEEVLQTPPLPYFEISDRKW